MKNLLLLLLIIVADKSYALNLDTFPYLGIKPKYSNEQSTTVLEYRNDFVNPHTGALNIVHRDVNFPGSGGMNIEVFRLYNSQSINSGLTPYPVRSFNWAALGLGWRLTVAPRLYVNHRYSFQKGSGME